VYRTPRPNTCWVQVGFMRFLGYELKIGDVIESCHIAASSKTGAEFRDTTPIREINGTKNCHEGCYRVEVDLTRYIGALCALRVVARLVLSRSSAR
jgi:hypothetical protein